MATASRNLDHWDSLVGGAAPESGIIARDYSGLWVALTNCTFDPVTKKPVEGTIVDSDKNFSALSHRMRDHGRCACAIVFCDQRTRFESQPPPARH